MSSQIYQRKKWNTPTIAFRPELPARIFLVGDNPEHSFIAVIVLHQLLREGCEVIIAENADEALNQIERFTEYDRPDLILVDLRLPDNRGLEVVRGAVALDRCTRVPVFVIASSLYGRTSHKVIGTVPRRC